MLKVSASGSSIGSFWLRATLVHSQITLANAAFQKHPRQCCFVVILYLQMEANLLPNSKEMYCRKLKWMHTVTHCLLKGQLKSTCQPKSLYPQDTQECLGERLPDIQTPQLWKTTTNALFLDVTKALRAELKMQRHIGWATCICRHLNVCIVNVSFVEGLTWTDTCTMCTASKNIWTGL